MEEKIKPAKFFNNANKTVEAYHRVLQPLCKESNIPPIALDILLYVANNPENATAKEICKYRGVKPGIVSVYVEKMAGEGLLERKSDSSDRRKIVLSVTEKALPTVRRGQELQKKFGERLLRGLTDEDVAAMRKAFFAIETNVEAILKSGLEE